MNFDYTPLQTQVTKEELSAYKTAHPHVRTYNIAARVVAIAAVGLFALMSSINIARGEFNPTFIIFLFVVIFVYVYGTEAARQRFITLIRLSKFAQLNGLKLVSNKSDIKYAGLIFQDGHSKVVTEAFELPNGQEIGNYKYVTGDGKNAKTHNWAYLRAKLIRRVPHMILDSKKNNMLGGRMTNLPAAFSGGVSMKLGGNFDEYFTVRVPVGYEKDALYVFTPDVMAALIDFGAKYDIEVIDDDLYIYADGKLRLDNEAQLRELLTVLSKVSSEVIAQGDYYADERVGDRAANVIAEQGQRMRPKATTAAIVSVFIISILIGVLIAVL